MSCNICFCPLPSLPHKSLYVSWFLRPFEALIQKHVPCEDIDDHEPYCLEYQSIIVSAGHYSFWLAVPAGLSVAWDNNWLRANQMQTPEQPGKYRVSWLNQRSGDKAKRGREKPDQQECHTIAWWYRFWCTVACLQGLLTFFRIYSIQLFLSRGALGTL